MSKKSLDGTSQLRLRVAGTCVRKQVYIITPACMQQDPLELIPSYNGLVPSFTVCLSPCPCDQSIDSYSILWIV